MRLLLVSNSTHYGGGYLDHCAPAIQSFFASGATPARHVLFVPYALADRDGYAASVRTRLQLLGYDVDAIHQSPGGPIRAVERADAIFIGGGNTFRLIDALWREDLVEPIRRCVRGGMPYLGISAGLNVACPSIRTTNDMPIVQPPSLAALHLVPFNINPHYQDPLAGSTHMGETREQRIAEFHEENAPAVVGLREGTWLHREGAKLTLGGSASARVFRRGDAPKEFASGSTLDFLLQG